MCFAMSKVKFLNLFNWLFVSPVHVDNARGELIAKQRNRVLNIVVIASLATTVCWAEYVFIINNYEVATGSIATVVTFLKYAFNILLLFAVIFHLVRHGSDVVAVCNALIAVDQTIYAIQCPRRHCSFHFASLKLTLALVFLWRTLFAAYQLILQWYYEKVSITVSIIVSGNCSVELSLDLNTTFITFLGMYLSQCYEHLRLILKKNDNRLQMAVYEVLIRLDTFKRRLAHTFGFLLLVLVLEHFVVSSIHAFLLIVLIYMSENDISVIINAGMLLAHIAIFYTLAYFYDSIKVKEAELKNALKTMQYSNIEHQSIDQKDFYDLINLKLMMESPKITACGLFEINLEVFYNVFAAIITYIVILFQFRSFETSP
ncbi:uncharacterized protein LOC125957663 isoform X2 [Anopheles darlingi]|uniref:uncharacterized protein LOC125957663 isoform X2 n=1 Tax=Anopheles darlingi TaxID=43151 RepID=UPI002100506D|nr:uncharacterized protein LOC125957663 isoform X2 [Anopheles darlingi]